MSVISKCDPQIFASAAAWSMLRFWAPAGPASEWGKLQPGILSMVAKFSSDSCMIKVENLNSSDLSG